MVCQLDSFFLFGLVEIKRPRKGDENVVLISLVILYHLVEIKRPRKGDENYDIAIAVCASMCCRNKETPERGRELISANTTNVTICVEIERPRKGDENTLSCNSGGNLSAV